MIILIFKPKNEIYIHLLCSNTCTSLESLLKAFSSYQYKWPICNLYANTQRVLANKHNIRA